MADPETLDALFHEAVAAIDAGDVDSLARLLAEHPQLVEERLDAPGDWLRAQVGDALEGFFQRPYLMWFVAEDPVRNGKLPGNIVAVFDCILRAAQRRAVSSLPEQLDYTLRLVCWSWIARECGLQIPLVDALIDAGATLDGASVYEGRYGAHSDAAIYNRNFAAAERLLERGATPTLTTALCLGRWDEAERLKALATPEALDDAFVQAALLGQAEALRRMLAWGLNATTVSARNQSHGTALHHAVWSGSLEAVQTLVEAGADMKRRDTIYGGAPLDWAQHAEQTQSDAARKQQYREIAAYLVRQAG